MDARCFCGGICELRELIEEHPAEIAYDFRTNFGISITDIGYGVTYYEAVLLVSILLRSTHSWLQAKLNGWEFPVERQWIVASHTYDLLASVNSGKGKKPKPYPNPFPKKNVVKSGKTNLSFEEVRAVLDKMNPKEP